MGRCFKLCRKHVDMTKKAKTGEQFSFIVRYRSLFFVRQWNRGSSPLHLQEDSVATRSTLVVSENFETHVEDTAGAKLLSMCLSQGARLRLVVDLFRFGRASLQVAVGSLLRSPSSVSCCNGRWQCSSSRAMCVPELSMGCYKCTGKRSRLIWHAGR
jgi:hypothetical protein